MIGDKGNKLAFIVLLVTACSLLDGVLTIEIIKRGATELNPVMQYAMVHGTLIFMLSKIILTVAGMTLLAVLAPYQRLALYGMYFMSVTYILLIGYHFLIRATI